MDNQQVFISRTNQKGLLISSSSISPQPRLQPLPSPPSIVASFMGIAEAGNWRHTISITTIDYLRFECATTFVIEASYVCMYQRGLEKRMYHLMWRHGHSVGVQICTFKRPMLVLNSWIFGQLLYALLPFQLGSSSASSPSWLEPRIFRSDASVIAKLIWY